ncbi:MAG: cytidylate kinase [Flexibacter sp. CG_4_10_14_3_um_filter_32_15]|nr:MAG: cytidylate kinase [Flexibacter sp. CG_4_10_14_3_um_filter_32_15]
MIQYQGSKNIIIAIDGYSGCGKSSTAKSVAARLGYAYIDTGAMYRAVTLYFYRHRVEHTDKEQVRKALTSILLEFKFDEATKSSHIYLNGENIESLIRQMHISERVSQVSTIAEVRHFLVAQQRQMGTKKGIVMDGRDIGTVVFPNAELKIFMTAQVATRALRRQKELENLGQHVVLSEIITNLEKRDLIDSTREESPLRKANDAIEIDTTNLEFEEQVERVLELMKVENNLTNR